MPRRALTATAMSSAVALTLASAAPASGKPITIDFEKDCPVLTCEETSASPVDVSTVVTPLRSTGGVLHVLSTETISSAAGSLTLSLAGTLNFNKEPDRVVQQGTVVSGSWDGTALAGARVHVTAVRVGDSTVFRGTTRIMSGSGR